jgi:hypothetical protein
MLHVDAKCIVKIHVTITQHHACNLYCNIESIKGWPHSRLYVMNNVLSIDIHHTLEQPKAINDYQISLNLWENSKDPNY